VKGKRVRGRGKRREKSEPCACRGEEEREERREEKRREERRWLELSLSLSSSSYGHGDWGSGEEEGVAVEKNLII
jgi:hypothetical protein